jgi:hypothetical protein
LPPARKHPRSIEPDGSWRRTDTARPFATTINGTRKAGGSPTPRTLSSVKSDDAGRGRRAISVGRHWLSTPHAVRIPSESTAGRQVQVRGRNDVDIVESPIVRIVSGGKSRPGDSSLRDCVLSPACWCYRKSITVRLSIIQRNQSGRPARPRLWRKNQTCELTPVAPGRPECQYR